MKPPPPLIAVVLAAGASTRMGESKAALLWRGQSFVSHCVGLGRAAIGSKQAVFVVEGARPLGAALPAGGGFTLLRNEGWKRGPLSSLQCALAHPNAKGCSALVLSVDRPHLAQATVRRLCELAYTSDPTRIWQPARQGKRGHPILWPADLCEALLALDPESSPRELLARPEVATRRASYPVADPAIFDNIDDPQGYSRLRGLTPQDPPG